MANDLSDIKRRLGDIEQGLDNLSTGADMARVIRQRERVVHVSGQIPVAPDGRVPEAFQEQVRVTWRHIEEQLASGGATLGDIVSHTVTLRNLSHRDEYQRICDELLGPEAAASAVIMIRERADWSLEVSALAIIKASGDKPSEGGIG